LRGKAKIARGATALVNRPGSLNRMTRRVIMTASAVALGLMCVSCGRTGAGLSSVSGKVMCNGQPAAGAMLYFHRQPGGPTPPRGAAEIIPFATVAADGSFAVESQPLGYGAAPGKYHILVQWTEEHDPAQVRGAGNTKVSTIKGKTVALAKRTKLDPLAPDRLKGRYSDPAKPLLQADVKPGSNDLGTLELQL
jgi:hypothetical protein